MKLKNFVSHYEDHQSENMIKTTINDRTIHAGVLITNLFCGNVLNGNLKIIYAARTIKKHNAW